MGIPVPLFWLRTFYVEFRWSPDEVHLESRYIEYKYANSSIFQVDSRWTPDGYWSPAGVHLNSVGECKVLATSDIVICYSHLAQFKPLRDRHSPFWSFSNARTFWGAFTHPRKSSKNQHLRASSSGFYPFFVIHIPLVSPFVVPVLVVHPRRTRPSPRHSF
jgi:hypothetical protein